MRRLAVVIICACVFPVTGARAWTWPVDGPVLRPFAFDRAHPYAGGQHRGVDLGAPSGSPVLASAEGIVSFAGTVPTGGKTVSIETASGYTATLVHLGSIGVVRGAHVDEGSVVGTVGPSGVAELTQPYVYFGTRVTSDPQGYVDPLNLLPSRPAPAPAAAAEPAVAAAPVSAAPAAAAGAAPAAPAPVAPVEATPAVPTGEVSSDSVRSARQSPEVTAAEAATPVEQTIANRGGLTIRSRKSRVASEAAFDFVTLDDPRDVRLGSSAASGVASA